MTRSRKIWAKRHWPQ